METNTNDSTSIISLITYWKCTAANTHWQRFRVVVLISNIDSHIPTFTTKPAVNQALWWRVVKLYAHFRAMSSFKREAGNGNAAPLALWAAVTVVCLLSCMQETCSHHDSF